MKLKFHRWLSDAKKYGDTESYRNLKTFLGNAVLFIVPDMYSIKEYADKMLNFYENDSSIEKLLGCAKPPYPTLALQTTWDDDTPQTNFIGVQQVSEDTYLFYASIAFETDPMGFICFSMDMKGEEEIKYTSCPPGLLNDYVYRTALSAVGSILTVCAMINAKSLQETPVGKVTEMRARQAAKKLKMPLKTHRIATLLVPPPRQQKQDLGGTHASPRVHLRRGHWRTFKSGRQAWVKACVVGDKTKGIVTKDYCVVTDPE